MGQRNPAAIATSKTVGQNCLSSNGPWSRSLEGGLLHLHGGGPGISGFLFFLSTLAHKKHFSLHHTVRSTTCPRPAPSVPSSTPICKTPECFCSHTQANSYPSHPALASPRRRVRGSLFIGLAVIGLAKIPPTQRRRHVRAVF